MARLHRIAAWTLCLAAGLGIGNWESCAQTAASQTPANAASQIPANTASQPSTNAASQQGPAARPPSVPLGVSLDQVADAQMARGQYVAALATLQQIQPRTAAVWDKIGVAYHHLYAFDQAMQCYREAVALNPRFSEAYNNIGAVYYGRLRYSTAVKEYKRSLKYNSRAAVTYLNLGTAYFAQTRYKKGVEEYRKALKIDPTIFDANRQTAVDETGTQQQRMERYFYVAEIYASFGRTQDALASLRKAFSEGFKDRKRLREDKELAVLRDMPEFHQLLIEEHME